MDFKQPLRTPPKNTTEDDLERIIGIPSEAGFAYYDLIQEAPFFKYTSVETIEEILKKGFGLSEEQFDYISNNSVDITDLGRAIDRLAEAYLYYRLKINAQKVDIEEALRDYCNWDETSPPGKAYIEKAAKDLQDRFNDNDGQGENMVKYVLDVVDTQIDQLIARGKVRVRTNA